MSKGTKFDADKSPLAYLPPRALIEVGFAFWAGAQKYGPFNYMQGLPATRLASGALRHILLFLAGENFDTDIFTRYQKKVPHWACAIANLLMLGEMLLIGRSDLDDRYKGVTDEKPFESQEEVDQLVKVAGGARASSIPSNADRGKEQRSSVPPVWAGSRLVE